MKYIKLTVLLLGAATMLVTGCRTASCCQAEKQAGCGMACCAKAKTDCASCPQCSAKK